MCSWSYQDDAVFAWWSCLRGRELTIVVQNQCNLTKHGNGNYVVHRMILAEKNTKESQTMSAILTEWFFSL